MKIFYYVLTVLLGAYGLMGVLRFGEMILLGRLPLFQGAIGVIALILAFACLKKARAAV